MNNMNNLVIVIYSIYSCEGEVGCFLTRLFWQKVFTGLEHQLGIMTKTTKTHKSIEKYDQERLYEQQRHVWL